MEGLGQLISWATRAGEDDVQGEAGENPSAHVDATRHRCFPAEVDDIGLPLTIQASTCMDAFVSKKRRRSSPSDVDRNIISAPLVVDDDESTDFKLAVLASLHPELDHPCLLEALLAFDGSVERASDWLKKEQSSKRPQKKLAAVRYQSSFTSYTLPRKESEQSQTKPPRITQKGKTLHLYSPEDVEKHTPCSIIHNFLPSEEADALLRELLNEVPTFGRQSFKLFDNVVQSPHTMCFYVDSWDEAEQQKTEYVYNGSHVEDVRRTLPEMAKVSRKVQDTVNSEILRRIEHFQGGERLKYQSAREWTPNASFVNCYDGGAESVGYHSDQMTYLGPRAVIGSLSLGVAREFRVRKIVARDEEDGGGGGGGGGGDATARADAEGQIAIHLPHNSLLVMHAGMQEEWKHSIAPAAAIDPHPLAGRKRINVTYRHYKPSLHPRFTPRCACGVAAVLRCVQRKRATRGRYMWMCHAGYSAGREGDGCGFFKWAEFDEEGEPVWEERKGG
ncbi:uncharacterized protein K452DRAFT_314673 [Aplosporella prunicola CBS 121167]|uniref:Uncharacterized protein n=1 Tax=Aplosporella prunicola CBS 121167 TaxID=1176127 RepID=A0A6A6BUP9_9PEZI|nr:uncharacterized protein K452DRAFT_314673 [Aplosporella prunicola CBS 121167]KAF2147548.1 hypothetical protein K452DRAFT_314673 [Aplosporella prunicola CBS 121167]